ncbi:MAG: exonuclease domain-containing protein [Maledivibacter sp.]|jgi:DNA polymerase-3 subunit epsilon|nr:exonuclease domain-containing protein [Maledivibacter sp.]
MNFVAIDFETANSRRSSACAMGIAVVKDGEIIEKKSWLIRPKELRFDRINVYIHGITKEDVKNEPEFNELWDSIKTYLENQIVVAHNASFDMSVLRHILNEYDIPYPSFDYLCTVAVSKATWQEQVNNKLDTLANMLNITFKHHDACHDAVACAKVLLAALKSTKSNSVEDLCINTKIKLGKIYERGYEPCKQHRHSTNIKKVKPIDQKPLKAWDKNHLFYHKKVIFTGPLRSMTRSEANKKVESLGGFSGYGVTKDTSYLVVGIKDYKTLKFHELTTKLRKAYSYIEQGINIEIIPEEDFLRML